MATVATYRLDSRTIELCAHHATGRWPFGVTTVRGLHDGQCEDCAVEAALRAARSEARSVAAMRGKLNRRRAHGRAGGK